MIRVSLIIQILVACSLALSIPSSFALDGNKKQETVTITIHEAARQIRQYKSWQILDASPRKLESGDRILRFKLLHEKGKVIIINIDPKNPNFRRLE